MARLKGAGPPSVRGSGISELFKALYANERGVSRIYEMSFSDDVWKLWRDAPGFHQRFEGHLSSDRRIVEARWEKSSEVVVWEKDFDIVYLKRGTAEGLI